MGAPGPGPRPGRQVPDRAHRTTTATSPTGTSSAHSPSYVNWIAPARVPRRRQPRTRRPRCSATGSRSTPSPGPTNPPAMEFVSVSGQTFNTIHANNFEFYDETADGHRPRTGRPDRPENPRPDRQHRHPQGPPVRTGRAACARSSSTPPPSANATARAIALPDPRGPSNLLYEDSYWKRGFFGGNYQWLIDGGGNGRNLDARTRSSTSPPSTPRRWP